MARTAVSVEILMGLPGSGKTHYAKNEKRKFLETDPWHKDTLEVIHFDQEKWTHPQWFEYFRQRLILDGLFLTTDDVISVINQAKTYAGKRWDLKFTIIRWKENREACMYNDYNRRTEHSKLTIKKAKFEYPDIARIKEETGYKVTVKEVEVIKKPAAFNNIPSDIESRIEGNYLVSRSWILSGEQRSYDSDWKPMYSEISSDSVPEFEELYSFLEAICPSLTFLDSRRIFKEFVTVKEFEDNDYYTRTHNARYICDLSKITDFLKEKGYIAE